MVYFKRISQIFVFLIGLFILLRGLSFVFMPKNNMENFGMEEVKANGILGEKENSIDVVVIGDSETYCSISPMEIWDKTGYTSYVCGSSGQPLNYSVKVLKRALKKQQPKIVILETNMIFRNVTLKNTVLAELGEEFSIFDYHDNWKKINVKDIFKGATYTWTDDTKGYVFSTIIAASEKKDHMKPTEECAVIADTNYHLIKKIKELCDENGAKLLLLSTPSTINWNYSRHNSVQKLSEELECEYIDLNLLNDMLKIDWSKDTRDKGDHLNHYGAVKVSEYVADYLKNSGLLMDHRTDKEFKHWNDAFKAYSKTIEGK